VAACRGVDFTFAALPAEQIAGTIAPNLQRYLTGDLPDGLAP
jgi:hypothetical protein